MQWEGKEDGSGRVEDRRGIKPGVALGGGVASLIVLVLVYLGVNPNIAQFAGNAIGNAGGQQQQGNAKPINDENLKFSEAVMTMTDRVWSAQFKDYVKPKMVLFAQAVNTKCGKAPSSVGPFYCPADQTVYLDPTFFDVLEKQLGGSKAKFSQAYVIAHEVGHHVQNLLGYNARLERFSNEGKNAGIRLELQADYLAGVWAYHADKQYRILEPGDVEEAIRTAKKIGDDAIIKNSGGWPSPESFTHGTSDQRYKYFMMGLKTGNASREKLEHFFDPSIDPLKL